MPHLFDALGDRLLRAGVAPVHVRRYLRELSEHISDLTDGEREAGRSLDEARAAALTRLGGEDALAEAMLAQPALRSWTGRAPWATLVIGPFVLLVLVWLVPPLVTAFMLGAPVLPKFCAATPPVWTGLMLDLIQGSGPLVIAPGIAFIAARQRSRLVWPILGCAAVGYVGGGYYWGHWPVASSRFCDLHIWFQPLRGAVSLAVSAAVYWWASRARSPQPPTPL